MAGGVRCVQVEGEGAGETGESQEKDAEWVSDHCHAAAALMG